MQCFVRILPTAFLVVSALGLCGQASAITLFADTFDRPDNRDIDVVSTGITNNTGTALGASAVYSQPWIDPNAAAPTFGVPDANAANGGGQQILSNEYQLKYGVGTSNAFVNHNFTNASILSAGGFSVSLDVLGYNQATNGQGAAIAIGMSQAEALTAQDAVSGLPKLTNTFQDGTYAGTVLADFYLGIRGNSTIAFGPGGASNVAGPTILPVSAKTGTISANFGVTSFNVGSTVTYEVFYIPSGGSPVSAGVGTFSWSGTNENYIGLDGRDNTVVRVDNFKIETIVPPPKPTLLINRDTGNITLQNLTTSPLSIAAYSILTTQGGFNQGNWTKIETQSIDVNDDWITFTAPASTTDLAEGTLGELTMGANVNALSQINFGNAWRRSPFEDVAFELRNSAGDDVPVLVQYTGNGGSPFQFGDLSLNGVLDSADWVTLRSHLTSSVATLAPIDRYYAGDLNADGLVNQSDFRQFKDLYTSAHGAGSFAALLAVPEPSSVLLWVVASMGVCVAWRRRLRFSSIWLIAAVVTGSAMADRAVAADLFVDTFNRADSLDIDGSAAGITNNTGTSFGASAVYSTPWVDPNTIAPIFGAPDADAANGGAQQILASQLQKYGAGTANLFVNHNFVGAAISTPKGFRVSVDVASITGTANAQGGAFGIGMSLAEAQSGHDANDGGTTAGVTPIAKFTNAFENSAFTTGTVLSDFYLGIRGDSTIAFGMGGSSSVAAPSVIPVSAKTGTISAEFVLNDFNAGSSVGYQVFYNGVSQGYGTFVWSGTNANYIGLDARDPVSVNFDNFKVEAVSGLAPQTLRLQVNMSSGAASIVGGGSTNDLDFYEITSAAGGLVAGGFNGIRGDNGLPLGNGSGNGWELGGANSASSLTEAYLLGKSTIAANAGTYPLGTIYNSLTNSRDLRFTYTTADNVQRMGFVEYVASTLPDFNGNGKVDAADYTVWRDHLGQMGGATLSQGDANGDGNVTVADYNLWKSNFGAIAGAGSGLGSVASVPEATSLGLVAIGTMFGAIWGRRRTGKRDAPTAASIHGVTGS